MVNKQCTAEREDIDKFKEELPMEYAVELNSLLKKYF